jgi:signal transduction histidine kinase
MTGSLTDISRKKQADVEISNALQKQENLNALRTRFVTMASHEFKSPLTTIQTSSDLIDMVLANDLSADYDKVSKYTHRIRTQVRRLNNVLNDILVLGRLEAKQMPLKSEWIDLVAFLDDISEHVSHMVFDDRLLRLENASKRTNFWADYNLVMHMLLNLISNAFKYSPGAPPPIFRISNSADWMHFDIQDFGVGMTELDKTNIFSPFYRSERVENIKGYGLGLVLVKEIVDLHDGIIEVKSEVDSGTCITIKIPFSDQ